MEDETPWKGRLEKEGQRRKLIGQQFMDALKKKTPRQLEEHLTSPRGRDIGGPRCSRKGRRRDGEAVEGGTSRNDILWNASHEKTASRKFKKMRRPRPI
jgi:hypothetical protein